MKYYGNIEVNEEEWIVDFLKKYFPSPNFFDKALESFLHHFYSCGGNYFDNLRVIKLSAEFCKNKHVTIQLARKLRDGLLRFWDNRYEYKNWVDLVFDFFKVIEEHGISKDMGDLTKLTKEYEKVKYHFSKLE